MEKYNKITGTQFHKLTQLLVLRTNLSEKRAIKAINRYNGSVDFANAHSRKLSSILKGTAQLVPRTIILNSIIRLAALIVFIELFKHMFTSLRKNPKLKRE